MCSRYPTTVLPAHHNHLFMFIFHAQLFATNLGDQYLPSTLPTNGGTLHWSITRSSSSGATFIKASTLPHLYVIQSKSSAN